MKRQIAGLLRIWHVSEAAIEDNKKPLNIQRLP